MSLIVLQKFNAGLATGSGDFALDGSGTAAPAGMNALFLFNGLYLNDRSVIDKYRITEIGGFDDADVRDAREANPGSHGETAGTAWYGGRTITLTGRIEAHTRDKLEDMQQALRSAFIGLKEMPLTILAGRANQRVMINCRKSQPLSMREVQSNLEHRRDFLITLRASNPRFYSLDRKLTEKQGAFTANTETSAFSCVNDGNFQSQPIIRLTGPFNAGTRVYNAANAMSFTTSKAIATGSYVDIDVSTGIVRDNLGALRFDTISLASDPNFILIEPGINDISITSPTAGTSTSRLSFQWSNTWM